MSIGCWERAFAGEIFYCLPTGMPTYKDFMEVAGHMSARVNQNRRFYTTEAELEKVSFEPGISVDINFVTTIAVKLAIDILNRDNKDYTQRLLPHLHLCVIRIIPKLVERWQKYFHIRFK